MEAVFLTESEQPVGLPGQGSQAPGNLKSEKMKLTLTKHLLSVRYCSEGFTA